MTFDDPNISPSEKSGKIKERLRLFFSKRPGLDTLTEKGIIKCKDSLSKYLYQIRQSDEFVLTKR